MEATWKYKFGLSLLGLLGLLGWFPSGQGGPSQEIVIESSEEKVAIAMVEVDRGRRIFEKECAGCHNLKEAIEANPVMDLTDGKWKHGGKLADIERTIKEGVPDTEMQPLKTKLLPREIRAVAKYVYYLNYHKEKETIEHDVPNDHTARRYADSGHSAGTSPQRRVEGILVDQKCARFYQEKDGAGLAAHGKGCALGCKESGYGLMTGSEYLPFKVEGSRLAQKWLEQTRKETNLKVVVVFDLDKASRNYTVTSIEDAPEP